MSAGVLTHGVSDLRKVNKEAPWDRTAQRSLGQCMKKRGIAEVAPGVIGELGGKVRLQEGLEERDSMDITRKGRLDGHLASERLVAFKGASCGIWSLPFATVVSLPLQANQAALDRHTQENNRFR